MRISRYISPTDLSDLNDFLNDSAVKFPNTLHAYNNLTIENFELAAFVRGGCRFIGSLTTIELNILENSDKRLYLLSCK